MKKDVKTKTVDSATKKELLSLPHRKWDDTKSLYDSVLLVNTGKRHDSGWNRIAIIGCRKQVPVEICASCCDDIQWRFVSVPGKGLSDFGFRMDCAPKSGAIQAWSVRGRFAVGLALSSTEIVFTP